MYPAGAGLAPVPSRVVRATAGAATGVIPGGILVGMTSVTTIKVSRELRDRLAIRAAQQQTTLAGAIAQALDDSDERAFWDQVRHDHAAISQGERRRHVVDATLADDLADPVDDAIGVDEW